MGGRSVLGHPQGEALVPALFASSPLIITAHQKGPPTAQNARKPQKMGSFGSGAGPSEFRPSLRGRIYCLTLEEANSIPERRFAGAVILRGYKDLVGTSVPIDDKVAALSWFLSDGTERGSFDHWCRLLDVDPIRYRDHLRHLGLLPCSRTTRSDRRMERWLRRFFRRDLKRQAKHQSEQNHGTNGTTTRVSKIPGGV